MERPPLGRERRSQERAWEWEWGWAGETREMCLFGENFRAGDLAPGSGRPREAKAVTGLRFTLSLLIYAFSDKK